MKLHIRKATVIYIAAAILLLLTLGVGIAIVYSDYIYTANKGFYSMNISSVDPDFMQYALGGAPDEKTYERMQKETAKIAEDLDEWAKENQASLFLRSIIPFYPHLSVALYSDFAENLKTEKIGDEETGLYVEKQMYEDPYMTQNGIFLPDQASQKIEYVYDREGLPRALQRRGYYFLALKQYKLPAASLYMSQIFTDAKDIEGLLALLKEHKIGYSRVQANEDKPLTRLKSLVSPLDFYNMVLLLTVSAAIGGFIFLTFVRYRNEENEKIRHLNGKPLYRIFLEVILSGLAVFVVSYGILYLAIPKYCTYMTDYDVTRIRQWVGGALLLVTLISYGLASGRLVQKIRRR